MLRDDLGNDDDEGRSRPANLKAAAAQRRDQEAGDDGGDKAFVRGDTGADGDRHGERQRKNGNGDTSDRVVAKVVEAVAAAQGRDELRREQLAVRCPVVAADALENGVEWSETARLMHKGLPSAS